MNFNLDSNNALLFSIPKVYNFIHRLGILKNYKSIDELYSQTLELFSKSEISSFQIQIGTILKNCEAYEVRWIHCFDQKYPKLLSEIYDPPIILFYKGNLNILSEKTISIVGTRKPSPITEFSMEAVVDYFVQLGYTCIVSGLAIGLDRIAMEIGICKNLKVVGVLGTGLDKKYPYLNWDLYQKIENNPNCLLISEYRIKELTGQWGFPRRNRIITGLSEVTVIMEAPLKSGAMSSASSAISQSRDLMVFHHEEQINNEGGKKLLEEGASLLEIKTDSKFVIERQSNEFPKEYILFSEYLSQLKKEELQEKIKKLGYGYYQRVK